MTARFASVRDQAGVQHVELRHLRHFAATQLLAAGWTFARSPVVSATPARR